MSRRAGIGWVGAVALALGCVGPGAVDLGKLPESPVALLYRDEAMALDRIDAIRDLEKRGTPGVQKGVVRVETLDALFGGAPEAQMRLRATDGHIALFDPATRKTHDLAAAPASARPLAWSPDRKRLLLSGRWRDSTQLFVWDRDADTFDILTAGEYDHPMGCLGADGRLVAVEARQVGARFAGRLLATPPGGGGLRPVTEGPSDVLPACSPRTAQVAYVTATADGALAIAVIDLDAETPTPRVIGRGVDPVFTPDGAWIVYAATGPRGKRLVRVRPDGAGRTAIGNGTPGAAHPAVSPDGAYVAYTLADDQDRERLRVRRFDGSGDRPFLTDGDATQPVW